MITDHQEPAEEVRIGHLADLHLGKKSAWDPAGAERLQSLRQALLRLAAEEPAAILIAGDVFDGPQVDRGMVQEAAKVMQRRRSEERETVPVIVIQGNHDPAEEVSLWDSRSGEEGERFQDLFLGGPATFSFPFLFNQVDERRTGNACTISSRCRPALRLADDAV